MASMEKEMIGGCCVCSDERGWPNNKLVYCDGPKCDVAVHQVCYGIRKVPAGEWFCRKCDFETKGNKVAGCELCPAKDGAFLPTSCGSWAHVVCALYIPEVSFGSDVTMEPVITTKVPKHRFQQFCSLCKVTKGACIKCVRSSCSKFFHVTCCQNVGLLSEEASGVTSVRYIGYCEAHWPYKSLRGMLAQKEAKACGMLVDMGSDEELEVPTPTNIPPPSMGTTTLKVELTPTNIKTVTKRRNSRETTKPPAAKATKAKEKKAKLTDSAKKDVPKKPKTPTGSKPRVRKRKDTSPVGANGVVTPGNSAMPAATAEDGSADADTVSQQDNGPLMAKAGGNDSSDILSDVARTMISLASATDSAAAAEQDCQAAAAEHVCVGGDSDASADDGNADGTLQHEDDAAVEDDDIPSEETPCDMPASSDPMEIADAIPSPERAATPVPEGETVASACSSASGANTPEQSDEPMAAEEAVSSPGPSSTSAELQANGSGDSSATLPAAAQTTEEPSSNGGDDSGDKSSIEVSALDTHGPGKVLPCQPRIMEDLLLSQWSIGVDFLHKQAVQTGPMNIASVLEALQEITDDNKRMEERIAQLERQRDHLICVNSDLEKGDADVAADSSSKQAESVAQPTVTAVTTASPVRSQADIASESSTTRTSSTGDAVRNTSQPASRMSPVTHAGEGKPYERRRRFSGGFDDRSSPTVDQRAPSNNDSRSPFKNDSRSSYKNDSQSPFSKDSRRPSSLMGESRSDHDTLWSNRRNSHRHDHHNGHRHSKQNSRRHDHQKFGHRRSADAMQQSQPPVNLPHPAMTPSSAFSTQTVVPHPQPGFPMSGMPAQMYGHGMYPMLTNPPAPLQSPFYTQMQQQHQQQQQQQQQQQPQPTPPQPTPAQQPQQQLTQQQQGALTSQSQAVHPQLPMSQLHMQLQSMASGPMGAWSAS